MIALLIFLATYVVLALGFFPGLRIDRTGATIIGASFMVAAGVLSFQEALQAIDWATIVMLLGMMIVVANLHLSGSSVGWRPGWWSGHMGRRHC